MAVTDTGTRLTEAHRLAQLQVRAAAVEDLLALWPMLDPARLNDTFPGYQEAMKRLLSVRKAQSADLAAAYYRAFRESEGARAALQAVKIASRLDDAAATETLLYSGPVTAKTAVRDGATTEQAMSRALSETASQIASVVLAGGRETIVETAKADPEAVGVARVTDGSPCAFCAMLSSRGAVYFSEETASFRPHNGCGCSVEAVFEGDYRFPGRGAEFRELWDAAKATGESPDRVFRYMVEGQDLDSAVASAQRYRESAWGARARASREAASAERIARRVERTNLRSGI